MDAACEFDVSNAFLLGQGSFSDVHLVEKDENQIVVKTLKSNQSECLEFFKKEYEILAKLEHRNVVKTIGGANVLKKQHPQFAILMEFCELGTLKQFIFNPNVIYLMRNVCFWSECLFSALHYLFKEHRIVHRDIKPENIFVTKTFVLKLGDFGMMREIDGTCSGTFTGTPRYMSPPQVDPEKTREDNEANQDPMASPRNDVYALGLVIWQLIERRLVFSEYGIGIDFNMGQFICDVIGGHLKRVVSPNCVREFQKIVESCCEFNRSQRPTIEKALNELKEFNKTNQIPNGNNDEFPKVIETQLVLIRPIGFFNLNMHDYENDDNEILDIGGNTFEKDGKMLLKKYKAKTISKKMLFLKKKFVEKFDKLSDQEKLNFTKKMEILVEKVRNETPKFFHEYFPSIVNDVAVEKEDFDEMNISEIFQNVINEKQRIDMHNFVQVFKKIARLRDEVSYGPWTMFYEGSIFSSLIKTTSDALFLKLKFSCFSSMKTGEEWLLIGDDEHQKTSIFSNKILDKYLIRKGSWNCEKKKIFLSNDDELHFREDYIILSRKFANLVSNLKSKVQTQINWLMNRFFDLTNVKTNFSSFNIEIGRKLPIPGYLFQLFNPPRVQCSHEPKCEKKKHEMSDNYGKDIDEFEIFYYSCSSEKQIDYLSIWRVVVCSLNGFNFVKDSRIFFKVKELPQYTEPLIFLQYPKSKSNSNYITVLHFDFFDGYVSDWKIPYLYSDGRIHHIEFSSFQQNLKQTPKNKLRYLVVELTRDGWKEHVVDYRGNQIKADEKQGNERSMNRKSCTVL